MSNVRNPGASSLLAYPWQQVTKGSWILQGPTLPGYDWYMVMMMMMMMMVVVVVVVVVMVVMVMAMSYIFYKYSKSQHYCL